MAKHIYIYVPGLRVGKTRDNWEEAKHPRKDDGKFGTGSGGASKASSSTGKGGLTTTGPSGGTAEHHTQQSKLHLAAAQKAPAGAERDEHIEASERHRYAAKKLVRAASETELGNKSSANALLADAEQHAARAAKHEANLTSSKAPTATSGNPRAAAAKANAAAVQRADREAEIKAKKTLRAHPMYSEADFDYLEGKGYNAAEIKALWDRDQKAGKQPQHANKNSPEMQQHFGLLREAMSGKKP